MGATNAKANKKSTLNFSDVKAKHDIHDATSRSKEIEFPQSLTVLNEEKPKKSNSKVADSLDGEGPGQALQKLLQGEEYVMQRREFAVKADPPVRAFVVSNFLTESECDAIISEADRIGFKNSDDVPHEYPTSYRNNQRMIVINKQLARVLWQRMVPHLTAADVANVTPVGFGTEGIWVPVGLNDGFVLSKYSPGQYFKPHQDGLYINKNEEHSIFSVVIYLNQGSSFKGGNLNFVDRRDDEEEVKNNEKEEKEGEDKKDKRSSKKSKQSATSKAKRVLAVYSPRKGEAIVFNSDALHEGEALESGYKYIMRTFIMFRRVTRFDDKIDYSNDENWLKTLQLFSSFDTLHVNGDTKEFTRAYLEAQAGQLKHRRTLHAPSGPFPIDVFRVIFAKLPVKDVLKAMTLSRVWYECGRDNAVWQRLFQQRYGQPSDGHVEFDWFTRYKNRTEKALSIFVIGDAATLSDGDLPRSRYPWVNTYHGPWDSSYLSEPFVDMERLQCLHAVDLKHFVLQNWLNESYYYHHSCPMEKIELPEFAMRGGHITIDSPFHVSDSDVLRQTPLAYFLHLASRDYSPVLIVTFPLIWAAYSDAVPQIQNCLRTDYARVSKRVLKSFLEASEDADYAGQNRHYDNKFPTYSSRLSVGFLEAGIAACCAHDIRTAVVIYYQVLYRRGQYLQLTGVVDLKLGTRSVYLNDLYQMEKKKGTKHLSFDGPELDNWLQEVGKVAIKHYASNIVFVSDCEVTPDYKVYWSNFRSKVQSLYQYKNPKLSAIKLWHTTHMDLYYGARKLSKGSAITKF